MRTAETSHGHLGPLRQGVPAGEHFQTFVSWVATPRLRSRFGSVADASPPEVLCTDPRAYSRPPSGFRLARDQVFEPIHVGWVACLK